MKVRELKSESAKWEQLANEAIADAGEWKRRTRQLEAALREAEYCFTEQGGQPRAIREGLQTRALISIRAALKGQS